MKIFKNRAIRWVLLTIGLCSIIALTGMNVYSLFNLREKMVEDETSRRIEQLQEITFNVRRDMLAPFRGINQLELEPMEMSVRNERKFPPRLQEKIVAGYESPIYKDIYFTPEGVNPCDEGATILRFNNDTKLLDPVTDYPTLLCDGVGLARTKAKIQLNDFEYRWNNIFEWETHRSFNIALLNLNENRTIGYITAELDSDYILSDLLQPMMQDYFGDSQQTGTVVWLRDWVKDEILISSDPSVPYDRELVDSRERFSSFFDNWTLMIGFLDVPVQQAYNATLVKNLIVLGVAVIFVFGALIFMFLTAQRERELSQRQAGFLANVTHELKTPLAVMQAAGENIQDGRVTEPERLQNYGKHIYNESIRLRSMIEKLLDVAKVDSGQALVRPAITNVNGAIEHYLNDNGNYLKEKGFTVEFTPDEEGPQAWIDPDSLDTVINNLTENAVKYSTDDLYIHFKVKSNDDEVSLIVEDHGMGIPKKDLKNIFRKFYRVEDSLVARTKGHGLGLSIVKNMVDLNQGEIKVKSSVGKGSEFIVTFPLLNKDGNSLKKSVPSGPESKEIVGDPLNA